MAELQNRWESEKQEKTQIQAEMDDLRQKYETDMASIDKAAENVTSPGQAVSGKPYICNKCRLMVHIRKTLPIYYLKVTKTKKNANPTLHLRDINRLIVSLRHANLNAIYFIRPRTFDLLVRFSADSSKMDPTKIKNHHYHFIFLLPPDSGHISGTTGPTEMVLLSKFVEYN